tara:strand:+ start:3764 stop:5704 length:1941 start_codon:yes stop_codon:yes gene_type:complete
MTNPIPRKISELPLLSSLSSNDFFPVVDVSDTATTSTGETKKVSYITLKTNIQNSINTNFTEEDPIFSASVAFDITQTNIDQWNAAYTWGNHAVQGYLQSLSAQSINNLVDVDTTGVAADNVLKWSGSAWIAGEVTSGTTINVLNDVGNVNIDSVADNQILRYNASAGEWENSNEEAGGVALTDFSVTTSAPSLNPSLSYNDASGQFTYTPPNLSNVLSNVVQDTSPQLGGDLDLNNNNIDGTGDVNITGEVKASSFRIKTNNATIAGTSGNNRDIKVIGGAPYYYDGTEWRQFYLIDAPTTIPSDTDWDNVMIRSTFDSDIVDVKYNVTPEKIYSLFSTSDAIDIVSAPRKVGGGSLRINSAARPQSRLRYPMTSNYSFTGAWTMEAWVFLDSDSWDTYAQSIFSGVATDPAQEFAFLVRRDNGGSNAIFSWFNTENDNHDEENGTDMATRGEDAVVDTWFHVALVRDESDAKIRLYINGTLYGSPITDSDIANPDYFSLGSHLGNNYNYDFDGFIDDVRISKSTRYTSSFTPPTTQLPVSGTTSQISIPPRYVQGEIDLGNSPTWTGTPGVTPSRLSAGHYRLTFATPYSTDRDYIVLAQGMDQGFGCYIEVSRSTDNVILHIRRADTDGNTDAGFIAVQVINK